MVGVMDVECPGDGAAASANRPVENAFLLGGGAGDGGYFCYEDDLFSEDPTKCYAALLRLRSSLIGSDRQKHAVVERGMLPRLIHLVNGGVTTDLLNRSPSSATQQAAAIDPTASPSDLAQQLRLRVASAQTLGSIAKGMDAHLKALIDSGAVPVLLNAVVTTAATIMACGHLSNTSSSTAHLSLIESCLRALKTIFVHPQAPVEYLYTDPNVVPRLLSLLPTSSVSIQISVATILTHACKTREHQNLLAEFGVVDGCVRTLLAASPGHSDVQVPALKLLAFLVFSNEAVAGIVMSPAINRSSGATEEPLVETVVRFMDRKQPPEAQLEASRVLAYLYRTGLVSERDPVLVYKAMPCVVRLTKEEEDVETRVLAAETLAFLIELSPELQRIAAISNHLIKTMATFLWWEPPSDPVTSAVTQHLETARQWQQQTTNSPGSQGHQQQVQTTTVVDPKAAPGAMEYKLSSAGATPTEPQVTSQAGGGGMGGCNLTKFQLLSLTRRLDSAACRSREMKKAAFRVFAALAANDEDLRKRIIETDRLMTGIVAALNGTTAIGAPHSADNAKLQMAAVSCLHSLSRSVQLLRTSFQDYPVWKPLMKILSTPATNAGSVDFLVVASSTLCNLLLEFSPSKEPILESGAIELLCQLTHRYDSALVLNGVWGLMNMAFRADQRIKVQIITTLGSDQIFRLLSGRDLGVMMKTLGLLRNLLSHKSDIDHVMNLYGKQVMQAVVLILEGDNPVEVKEQALCILANIADGDAAKAFIMSNEDVLKKVASYVVHTHSKLQIAAVMCVHNLSFADDAGAADRQTKLREVGVHAILHQLKNSPIEPALAEKVRSTLQQFAA